MSNSYILSVNDMQLHIRVNICCYSAFLSFRSQMHLWTRRWRKSVNFYENRIIIAADPDRFIPHFLCGLPICQLEIRLFCNVRWSHNCLMEGLHIRCSFPHSRWALRYNARAMSVFVKFVYWEWSPGVASVERKQISRSFFGCHLFQCYLFLYTSFIKYLDSHISAKQFIIRWTDRNCASQLPVCNNNNTELYDMFLFIFLVLVIHCFLWFITSW